MVRIPACHFHDSSPQVAGVRFPDRELLSFDFFISFFPLSVSFFFVFISGLFYFNILKTCYYSCLFVYSVAALQWYLLQLIHTQIGRTIYYVVIKREAH